MLATMENYESFYSLDGNASRYYDYFDDGARSANI